MNSAKTIPIIIGIIITIVGIIALTSLESDKDITSEIQDKLDKINKTSLDNAYFPKPREWITSGPFQIDRSKYILGEKIFVKVAGLSPEEKGQIAFLRPLNDTHQSVYLTIPFDGAKGDLLNRYLQPQLSRNNGFCTADDFVGEWRVVFRGTEYADLTFEITRDVLPGDEDSYEPVC